MKRVVLVSTSGYHTAHDGLLNSFLDRDYDLFCAVGVQCQLWEEVMDELAVGNGDGLRFITTTSHPDESVEDVIEFAQAFGERAKVEVVRV